MVRLPSLQGEIASLHYAALAPALILSQHLAAALAFAVAGAELGYDAEFWALPLRRLASLPGLSAWAAALAFAFSLAISWQLALLSFRRASRSGGGHVVAAFAAVPGLQVLAVAVLAVMPTRRAAPEPEPEPAPESEDREAVGHVIQGMVAGMAIIVFAVLVSAVTFGAYGWGLFVMTPFLVGVTTAYLANRRTPLDPGRTLPVVMKAAALGAAALVAVALEGIVCILMAAPLGAAAAAAGGAFGRAAALAGHRRGGPLLSLAVLPVLFALDGAMPPAVAIATDESIEISAPPSAVWEALISDDPIAVTPGMVAQAGLAYPLRGRLLGEGVGAERHGEFSTGGARERVTAWVPGRRLSFIVLSQPPAMEEMSPYTQVHAPHLSGYFETTTTSFELEDLPGGRTRLTARAAHMLRMDPVLYWEPVARWAIHSNVRRVLHDIERKAEGFAAATAN